MAGWNRKRADSMMSILFIPLANMRHKNVKKEKKHKYHLYYPQIKKKNLNKTKQHLNLYLCCLI